MMGPEGTMTDCTHENVALDFDVDSEAMTVHVYKMVCEDCQAEAQTSYAGTVVMHDWSVMSDASREDERG